MFRETNQKEGEEMETIIGPSVNVEGDFSSKGNMTIEGTISGTVKTEKDLKIGEGAKLAADVWAANAFIAGEVTGSLHVANRTEFTESAKVFGDIETKILVMASGSILNGRCVMGSEGKDANKKLEKKDNVALNKEVYK